MKRALFSWSRVEASKGTPHCPREAQERGISVSALIPPGERAAPGSLHFLAPPGLHKGKQNGRVCSWASQGGPCKAPRQKRCS